MAELSAPDEITHSRRSGGAPRHEQTEVPAGSCEMGIVITYSSSDHAVEEFPMILDVEVREHSASGVTLPTNGDGKEPR